MAVTAALQCTELTQLKLSQIPRIEPLSPAKFTKQPLYTCMGLPKTLDHCGLSAAARLMLASPSKHYSLTDLGNTTKLLLSGQTNKQTNKQIDKLMDKQKS